MNGYLQVSAPDVIDDGAAAGGPAVPILVVDDDYAKRFALTRLLLPLGYAIVEADSGPAALRCLLTQDFAAILLDVRMPGMDGFETAALIRTRPRSALTPIILNTASTRAELSASGMYGDRVADFMLAPIEPDELRLTVSVFGNLFLRARELAGQVHEVRARADRWQTLSHAAPVGLFETDRDHRYTYTNPRWSELTGIPAQVALGQDLGMIGDVVQSSRLVVGPGTDLGHRNEVSRRIEIGPPGHDQKTVLLISKPTSDDNGAISGWVGTLTDVTAVVRSETTVAAA